MFRNVLAAALRNLARNRLYAAISIVGLAVAFTAAILIAQFVRNEFSYDRWLPGYRQVYKITGLHEQPGQPAVHFDVTQSALAGQLRVVSPGGVTVARLMEAFPLLRHLPGDTGVVDQSFAWVDPDIFRVFPLPVLAGDLRSALQQPDTVVITRNAARKYFGRDLPIGDTLEAQLGDARHSMRVTAVLRDLPPNTNLTTEIFASGRSAYSALSIMDARPSLGNVSNFTFARLAPQVSAEDLQHALDVAGRPEAAVFAAFTSGARWSFHAVPLSEVHLTSLGGASPAAKPAGSRSVAYVMAVVGALIVLVAATNFVALLTARAARRGVEVGVRKTAGAGRADLMVQFIGEALALVVVAALIAMALAELLLPAFSAFTRRDLTQVLTHDPVLLAGLVGAALAIGLLAAVYPALVLSSFRPAAVFKGGMVLASGSPRARQALVAVQFAVLIGLIVTTVTIYRQTQFALSRGMGTSDSQLIVQVYTPCNSAFPDEVRKLPGVGAAACSSTYALNMPGGGVVAAVQTPGGRRERFVVAPVDFGFFELYGVRPLAGRLFSRDHGQDAVLAQTDTRAQPTVVINETAARKLGFSDPRAAIGRQMMWTRALEPDTPRVTGPSEIVGVVPDAPMTVRSATDPTFYFVLPKWFSALSIRMTGQDIPGTVRAIDAAWKRTGNTWPIREVFLSQFRLNLYLDIVIQGVSIAISASLAVLIAFLGLFALSAYTTERRTKEIGIRKAMGASSADVVRLLLWQFTQPVLIANLIAWPVGWWAMDRWLHGFSYRVVLSPWLFLAASGAALAIALATVSTHAVLVARAKPVGALRYE